MQHLSLDQTGLSSDHQHSHDKKIHSRGRPEYSGSYLLWYMQLHHMHFRFPRKFFQISPQIFSDFPASANEAEATIHPGYGEIHPLLDILSRFVPCLPIADG